MADIIFEHALLVDGWASDVRVTLSPEGLIEAVIKNAPRNSGEFISGYALAGMPNLHSHSFQRLMSGLTEYQSHQQDSFWTWRDLMYRFANRLAPDDIRVIYAYVYMEMLKAGFTSVAEFHYLHHAPGGQTYANPAEMSLAVHDGAIVAGIALTHLPVLYMRAGFDNQSLKTEQHRFYHSVDAYVALLETLTSTFKRSPNMKIGMALHSLRAVPPEAIKTVLDFRQAQHTNCPVHIHIAEQQAEVNSCLQTLKQRPVEWLLSHAEMDKHWCLVHATHINPAELLSLAKSGATAGLCPVTEANLGDGVFPLRDYMQAGGVFGIGSDSNVSIDPREELRLLEYGQRLTLQQRNIATRSPGEHTGMCLYQESLRGGSRACGFAAGSISQGHRGDFVIFDKEEKSLVGMSNESVVDSLIFNSSTHPPSTVMVKGKKVVKDGQHFKEATITTAYIKTIQRLRQQIN